MRGFVRQWLGISEPLLYPVITHEGKFHGVTMRNGIHLLPLFTRAEFAERYILARGAEQHLVGKGLNPRELVEHLTHWQESGTFDHFTIDPPESDGIRFGYAELSVLKEQARMRA